MRAPALAPGHELLDDPGADPTTVRSSLRHIARSNRWFGGWWAVRRGLERVLGDRAIGRSGDWGPGAPTPSSLTLLDVGCGSGDLARLATRWARQQGIALTALGVERHRTAAAVSRDAGVSTMLACASSLPLRDGSVDIVVASQLVHHLAEDAIIDFLRAADRLARVGVIIADLRRSRLAEAGFWAGSRAFGFDAATRADGITSVRRGFSASALTGLLRRAGLTARVERTPGFRLVATWTPAAGAR